MPAMPLKRETDISGRLNLEAAVDRLATSESRALLACYGADLGHLVGERATVCAARPLARRASLQLVGIARYSSSLRLPLHSMEHTAHPVQLPFLG